MEHKRVLLGAALMVVGMNLLPVGDGIVKYMTPLVPYSGPSMAWLRFLIGAILLAPIVLIPFLRTAGGGEIRNFRFNRFFFFSQILRGVLVACAISSMLIAVSTVPLADAFGGFFIGPVVSTLLARFLLRERVASVEWLALALGFAGVMLVVQPGFGLSTGLLYALAGGGFYGAFLTATRWAARSGTPPTLALLAQLIVGVIFLAPIGLPELLEHGFVEPLLLIAMAVSSALANGLAIMAYRFAQAVTLAPLVYVQILSAMLFGYVVFGDVPGPIAAAGLGLILASGGVLFWRGVRLARQ